VLFRSYLAISHQSVKNKCFFAIITAAPDERDLYQTQKDRQSKTPLTVFLIASWPNRAGLEARQLRKVTMESIAILFSCEKVGYCAPTFIYPMYPDWYNYINKIQEDW